MAQSFAARAKMRALAALMLWCWHGSGASCRADSWAWNSAQSMWVATPGDEPARDISGHTPAPANPSSAELCETPAGDPLASLTAGLAAGNLRLRTVLHDHAPSVVQYDNFFSTEVAADIIRAASDSPVAEAAQFGRKGGVVWLPHRNATGAEAAVVGLVARISELVGIESERAESLQVAWCERQLCTPWPTVCMWHRARALH